MNADAQTVLDLGAAVDEFLAREASSEKRRRCLDDIDQLGLPLWKQAMSLGWGGLMVPCESGGLGLGWDAAATVSRRLGRHLAPGPFVTSAALFTWGLHQAGQEAASDLLAALAEGSVRGAVALNGPSNRRSASCIDVRAVRSGSGWLLNGQTGLSLELPGSDMAIVSAMTDGDPSLFLVRLNKGGCEVETVQTVDRTRTYGYLVLRDVGVEDGLRLAGRPNLRDELLDIGAVLIAADALGAADRALELSVEYAKVRNQFGRPIGTFQAVKHKLVNMYIGLKSAEMSVASAVRDLGHGGNHQSRRSIAEAAMLARDSACQITGEAIQAHGGIGYTWEHDCHLLLKRAHLDAALFGSISYFAERVVKEYPEYEACEEATSVG